jgi:hypothetical protein
MKKIICTIFALLLLATVSFAADETVTFDFPNIMSENPEDLPEDIVIENVFHYKQVIPLEMGDNVFGRYVRGTNINKPIETVDPSVDTKHCIIRVQRNKRGELQYILRDNISNTGTFYMNEVLKDVDRVRLQNGDIITIGATSLILRTQDEENE